MMIKITSKGSRTGTSDLRMFGFFHQGTRVTNFVISLPTGRVATRTIETEDDPDIRDWVSASTEQALEWLKRDDLLYVPTWAYTDSEVPSWIKQPQQVPGSDVQTLIRRAKKIARFTYFEQTSKNIPRLIFEWPLRILNKTIDVMGGLIGVSFLVLVFAFIVVGLVGLLWFGVRQLVL